MMPPRFDAVIFDLDGVLTDTAHYHFLAWKRGYGKDPQCCSRECQSEWQKATRASVATRGPRKDSRSPEHMSARVAAIQERWAVEDRERQMMVQSGLHEPREDVQS